MRIAILTLIITGQLCAQRSSANIETIAGSDGAGLPASMFSLGLPQNTISIAAGADGSIYVSAEFSNRIYRVSPDAIVHIGAGSGSGENANPGALATASPVPQPAVVALDGSGNLFIAGTGPDVRSYIARVDASTGRISIPFKAAAQTVPITGIARVQDFGVNTNGDLYILDIDYRIKRVDAASGLTTIIAGDGTNVAPTTGSRATETGIGNAQSIAVSSQGLLYFVSTGQQKIYRVGQDGILNVFADTTQLGFFPVQIRLDSVGNVLALGAIGSSQTVLRIDAVSASPSILLGPNSPSAVKLQFPAAIAAASNGDVLLYNAANPGQVFRLDGRTGSYTSAIGIGQKCSTIDGVLATRQQLCEPATITIDAGKLYLTNTSANRILRLDQDGTLNNAAGGGSIPGSIGQLIPAAQVALNQPQGLWSDNNGDVYFSDADNTTVARLTADDTAAIYLAKVPSATITVSSVPAAASIAGDSQYLYISDPDRRTVWEMRRSDGSIRAYAGTGKSGFGADGGLATATALPGAAGLALDSSGSLYIADQFTAIRRVDPLTGIITSVIRGVQASGLAFAPDGRLCFTAQDSVLCSTTTSKSTVTETLVGTGIAGFSGDGGPAKLAELNNPTAIAFDDKGTLYIVDRGNERIRRVRGLWGPHNTARPNH